MSFNPGAESFFWVKVPFGSCEEALPVRSWQNHPLGTPPGVLLRGCPHFAQVSQCSFGKNSTVSEGSTIFSLGHSPLVLTQSPLVLGESGSC